MSDTALALFASVAGLPQPDLDEPAIAEFAAQFALDVSVIDATQRAAFFTATGDQAFPVAQRIYAHDFVPRVRAVLGVVLPDRALPEVSPYDGDSWPLLESFMTAVARLDTLDATTTELIRLRGARLHDCALCKSRRSQDALDAGASESTFAAVDSWPSSDLPARAKAALALTDALILGAPVDADIRRHLSDEQIVEVVLDVMRNAANKIAVALGADAANVTDGVELFTTDADGNLSVVGSS
jgi:AhpD family alkylhydroperoxidase